MFKKGIRSKNSSAEDKRFEIMKRFGRWLLKWKNMPHGVPHNILFNLHNQIFS